MTNDKVVATVVIHKIPSMTESGRKRVCDWLQKLAQDIQIAPKTFSNTFRARYFYHRVK